MLFRPSQYSKLISKEVSIQLIEKGIKMLLGFIVISLVSNFLGPEKTVIDH